MKLDFNKHQRPILLFKSRSKTKSENELLNPILQPTFKFKTTRKTRINTLSLKLDRFDSSLSKLYNINLHINKDLHYGI